MIKEQRPIYLHGFGLGVGEESIQGLRYPLKGYMLKVRPKALGTLINFPPPTSTE